MVWNHWAGPASTLPDTKKGTVSTQVIAVYTDCFSSWSTHQRVRIITANVQRTICQVESTKTASSLWNKRGWGGNDPVMLTSQPTDNPTHVPCVEHLRATNTCTGWEQDTRRDEGKTYDSCQRRPSWFGVLTGHWGIWNSFNMQKQWLQNLKKTFINSVQEDSLTAPCGLGSPGLCQGKQAFLNDSCHLVLNPQGGGGKEGMFIIQRGYSLTAPLPHPGQKWW